MTAERSWRGRGPCSWGPCRWETTPLVRALGLAATVGVGGGGSGGGGGGDSAGDALRRAHGPESKLRPTPCAPIQTQDLCVRAVSGAFEAHPGVARLPEGLRRRVVEGLALDLPLELVGMVSHHHAPG